MKAEITIYDQGGVPDKKYEVLIHSLNVSQDPNMRDLLLEISSRMLSVTDVRPMGLPPRGAGWSAPGGPGYISPNTPVSLPTPPQPGPPPPPVGHTNLGGHDDDGPVCKLCGRPELDLHQGWCPRGKRDRS